MARINLTLVRSKHGPTYKIKIDAVFGRIAVHGETTPVHVGLDRINFQLVRDILETRIFRSDGSGKPVPMGARMKIEKAVLARLKTLEAEVGRGDTSLRKAVIRLARENPDGIRRHLVPILRQASWSPPKVNTSLARQVAKVVSKPWVVKSLDDVRNAIGKSVVTPMSMSDRIDNQAAVKKWKAGLSKDDLHKLFRAVEKVQYAKRLTQYRMNDEAWDKLAARAPYTPSPDELLATIHRQFEPLLAKQIQYGLLDARQVKALKKSITKIVQGRRASVPT